MENYSKKTNEITKVKTLRLPQELIKKIEKEAEEQERDFSKQVIFIIKKYYEFKGDY